MNKLKEISIIVPSTIVNIEKKWVDNLNSFSEKGITIIISIPPNISIYNAYKKGFSKKIKIINAKNIGQVNQRQYAYKFSITKYIILMDDDILINIKI